jgi:uncharacterized damage-inducible protein DinB
MKKLLIIFLLLAVISIAQAAAPQSAPASNSLFVKEFLTDLDGTQDKLISLAKAVPEDKYGWRPADGVRSIGEVYMHIADSNFQLPKFAGVQPPANLPKEMEKITNKQETLDWLQKSFDHIRKNIGSMSDADLAKAAKLFGKDRTNLAVWLLIINHMHEHLGQSIAYARSNSIVPPWSMQN